MIVWTKIMAILGVLLAGTALLVMVPTSPTPALSADTPPSPSASKSTSEAKPKPKPQPPREKPKDETRLDEILRKWAENDTNIQDMHICFRRTDTDAVFERKTVQHGQTWFKKSGLLRVEMRDKEDRLLYINLLDTNRLRHFDFTAKREAIFPLRLKKLSVPQDMKPIWSLFSVEDTYQFLESLYQGLRWEALGPTAREISDSFKVSLAKEDQWYIYLDITPRIRQDKKAWYNRSRVVLFRDSYRVRQYWFEHLNRTETLLDYLDIQINPEPARTRESLVKDLPKGWECVDFSKGPKDEENEPAKPSFRR